jgi:hypothetical protein
MVAQVSMDRNSAWGRAWQSTRVCLAFTLILLAAGIASAQVFETPPFQSPGFDNPKPFKVGSVVVSGELRGRGEGWNWFLGDTRARYAFGDSLLRLRLAQHRRRFDWQIEVAQPTLYNLPTNAFTPVTNFPVGLGATYFAANGNQQNVAGLFVKQAFISIPGIDRNHGTLRVGRFAFSEGTEKSPRDRDLAWLQQQRIAHRLIGDSYWTDIGRSLDGVHFSSDMREKTNLTFVAGRATRGVWQTDGQGEMDVDILYAAYTREFPTSRTDSQLRVFAFGYHDGRTAIKVDNRPEAVRAADMGNIRIGTFGVNYAIVTPLPRVGKWDLVVWGAQQIGQWGSLSHRANSGLVEIGWRPPLKWLHPWLRAGAFFASGDGNPDDSKHATFFQPLPTQQQYARLPFYTLMNSEDYSGQLILQPTRKLTLRSEIHKVKLHSVKDEWYLGSGAFQNTSFGYDALPDNGHRGLGNYLDFNADYQMSPRLALRYYIGALSGKGAETDRPAGRKAGFTYLVVAYRF